MVITFKIKHLVLGKYFVLQEIMEGLRECREASIKQADEKEAELNEQRKNNCRLNEKLNNITTQKVPI
jgi:hypothetical protein